MTVKAETATAVAVTEFNSIKEELAHLIKRDQKTVDHFTKEWEANPLYAASYHQEDALEAQVKMNLWKSMSDFADTANTIGDFRAACLELVDSLKKELIRYCAEINNSTSAGKNMVTAIRVKTISSQLNNVFGSDLYSVLRMIDRAVERVTAATM